MKYKNLNDVMKDLTFLKNATNGKDIFDARIKAISDMLELFNIKWHFIEKDDRWIAELK